MQFRFTEEQELILDTARNAAKSWHDQKSALQLVENGESIDAEAWKQLGQEMGFAGLTTAEVYGGAELGGVELACVGEAVGAFLAPIPFVATCGLSAAVLQHCASDEMKSAWLPKLASGSLIATWAHRARGRETNTLRISNEGILSGWASHVVFGAAADLIIVSALDETGAEVIAVLEQGTEGLSVTQRTSLDLTQPVSDITCEKIQVAPSAWHRPTDQDVERALDQARIALAAEQLGAAQATFDATIEYVNERVQFGRKIGSFQAIKHRLADRACELESARSAVYYGACAFDEGHDDSSDAVAIGAWFAATTFKTCVRELIQFHGGIGFTWEHVAHLYFKRAWAAEKMLGSERRHLEHLATSLAQTSQATAS